MYYSVNNCNFSESIINILHKELLCPSKFMIILFYIFNFYEKLKRVPNHLIIFKMIV